MATLAHWLRQYRPYLLVAVVAAVGSFIVTLGAGTYVARGDRHAAVTFLGAGDRVSVLVTDGPARLLLASGTDAAEFGNAYATARPFGRSRLDLLLLTGTAKDTTFLSRVTSLVDARLVQVLGDGNLAATLGYARTATVPSPQRIRLSDETTVIVRTFRPSADAPLGWSMEVVNGTSRILVLSDPDISEAFRAETGRTSVTALLVETDDGDEIAQTLAMVQSPVVIVPEPIDHENIQSIGEMPGAPSFAIRVFGGEVQRVTFTGTGISLPANAIPLTPATDPASPSPD